MQSAVVFLTCFISPWGPHPSTKACLCAGVSSTARRIRALTSGRSYRMGTPLMATGGSPASERCDFSDRSELIELCDCTCGVFFSNLAALLMASSDISLMPISVIGLAGSGLAGWDNERLVTKSLASTRPSFLSVIRWSEYHSKYSVGELA